MRAAILVLALLLTSTLAIKDLSQVLRRRRNRGPKRPYATITGIDWPGGDRGTRECRSIEDAYKVMDAENDGQTMVVYGLDANTCWLKVLGNGNGNAVIQPNRVNIIPNMKTEKLGKWRTFNHAMVNGIDFPGGDLRIYQGVKDIAMAKSYADKWCSDIVAAVWSPSTGTFWVKDLGHTGINRNDDRIMFFKGNMQP